MVSEQGMQRQLGKLQNAHARLSNAVVREADEFIRDAVIQRFELAFELLWKTVKRMAEMEGLSCVSPKACFRIAVQMDLMEDENTLLEMLEARNLMSHTYDEAQALRTYEYIRDRGCTAIGRMIEGMVRRMGE